MPTIGSTVFVRLASESKGRILHPMTLTETAAGDSLTLQPDDGVMTTDSSLTMEVGMEILIYFDHQNQFMQQSAKVDAVFDGESGPQFILQTVGTPVSAEERQCFRVRTTVTDIYIASFGSEPDCPMLDISQTGFAVIASASFKIGQVVQTEIKFEGKACSGPTSIQSVLEMPDGRTRYGVNCIQTNNNVNPLVKAIHKLSMSVQRQQLNRLSGGAGGA
jgi:hypothetical protein